MLRVYRFAPVQSGPDLDDVNRWLGVAVRGDVKPKTLDCLGYSHLLKADVIALFITLFPSYYPI